ncbi:MAG: DUF2950 domain-containing protein [Candidatus Sulfotelmatobacter sp.]
MQRAKLNLNKFQWANLAGVVVLILMGCLASPAVAQQAGQKTFKSPEEASEALFKAAQSNDEKAMVDILGADGKQIVSSGDAAEDTENRANFVAKYEEMHRLAKEADGSTVLYIGAKNWPTPIPLMNKGGSWYFDTAAGTKEILFRRVGRNEMSTIRVCQELAAAEKEYSAQHGEYAQKIFSDEGQRNGLYWKAAAGEPLSPVGPLVAAAVTESTATSAPTPYRGYYYHALVRQGKNGPGGAKSYSVNGKMTGGFAFVAFPADYRSSGVMTFIVGEDGVVYQKDLGKKTEAIAKAMKEYNPKSDWQKAEEQQSETASSQKTK